jgi:NADH pyrophosphatase NudC (nudix superfamily)
MSDLISRQAAIDALWKALCDYEDETEKQFQESEDLDVGDWIGHKIFVQNMNDIDRQAILNLPTIEPKHGKWIKDGEVYALYKCTACNNLCTVAGYANCIHEEQMYKAFKFCPNCGAKMERSEE